MPAGVNEDKWKKAKEIASESDNCPEEDTDGYWAYVQGIYKRMNGGSVDKKGSELVDDRLRKLAAALYQPPEHISYADDTLKYDRRGSDDPAKARANLAKKSVKSARGETVPYKYLDSIRPVYGENTDEELRKAQAWNEKIGAPYNIRRDAGRVVPVNRARGPLGAVYRWEQGGRPVRQIDSKRKESKRFPRIEAWPYSSRGWDNDLKHEGVHLVSEGRNYLEDVNFEDFLANISPGHLAARWARPDDKANTEVNKAIGGVQDETRKLLENSKKAIGNSANRADAFIREDAGTNPVAYPERRAVEVLPPLAGLQQYLYTKTGSRIESPKGYDDFMNNWDSKSPDEKNQTLLDMKRGGFQEAYRLLQYREALKKGVPPWANKKMRKHLKTLEEQGYSFKDRLKAFDKANRMLIPGWAKSKGGSVNKQASELVNARLRKMSDELKEYRDYTFSDLGEGSKYKRFSYPDNGDRSIGHGANLTEMHREDFQRLAPGYNYDDVLAGRVALPKDSEASRRIHNFKLREALNVARQIKGFDRLPKFTRQRMFDAEYRGGEGNGVGPNTRKLFNENRMLEAIEEFRNRKDIREYYNKPREHFHHRLDRTTQGMSRFVRQLREKGWQWGEDWRPYMKNN